MYRGLLVTGTQTTKRPKIASRAVRYGLRDKVHSMRLCGMSGEDGPDYMGPPRPGQSWSQYEAFMSLPVVAGIGAATVGMLIGGPVGAIAGGVGSWFLAGGTKKKAQTQGG